MEGESSNLLSFVILFIGFVTLYCFFIVASVAIRRSSISRIEELENQKELFASIAKKILFFEDSYLLKCQLGQLIAASSFGWLFFGLFHQGKIQSLFNAGTNLGYPADDSLILISGGILAILLLAMIIFTLIQIAKAIVGAQPEKVLCMASLPIIFVCKLIFPLAWLVTKASNKIIKLFHLEGVHERNLVKSAEDITQILEHSSEAGEIDEEEREMIEGIFAFSETIVQEVMTPRMDIVFVRNTQSLVEIVEAFKTSGFSRILVCGEDLDDVIGVVLVKDLVQFFGQPLEDVLIKDIIRPPYFCSYNKKVDALLQDLRANAVHLAVVKDDHGGVGGIVTLEDLVEEIVGDIVDEFDISDDEEEVKLTENGDLLVDGGISIYDLNRDYSLNIPEGEYNTLAGFVIHTLGRIPHKGELLSYDGLTIKIEKNYQNRIKLLRILKGAKPLTKLSLVQDKNLESNEPRNESKGRGQNYEKVAEKAEKAEETAKTDKTSSNKVTRTR